MKKLSKLLAGLTVVVMILTMVLSVEASAASKGVIGVSLVTKGENFSSKRLKILTVKQKVQLKVRYITDDKIKTVTSKAKYKSSNKKVISVTKKGKLTAKKAGKATITVKYKGMTKKLKLTVKKKKTHTHVWKPEYNKKYIKDHVASVDSYYCGYTIVAINETAIDQSGIDLSRTRIDYGSLGLPMDCYVPTPDDPYINGFFPLEYYHFFYHTFDDLEKSNSGVSNYLINPIWREIEYVDGYYCECGADKDPVGNEKAVLTGKLFCDIGYYGNSDANRCNFTGPSTNHIAYEWLLKYDYDMKKHPYIWLYYPDWK